VSGLEAFRRLERAGLLVVGEGCRLSPDASLEPEDLIGTRRPVVLEDGCRIQGRARLHGGARVGAGAVVEDLAVVGAPEHGYAVGDTYPGQGGPTQLGAGAVVRAGAVIYAGVSLGEETSIGHYTVVRSFVRIGSHSQLAHHLVVERETSVGDYVRCSPLSHITSATVLEDRVFLGAGVVTVNDKSMIWKQPDAEPTLIAPHVEYGATVGSGSTLGAGVRIGRQAMVGSGSLVLRDVPPHTVAYGVPARVHRTLDSPLQRGPESGAPAAPADGPARPPPSALAAGWGLEL